MNKRTEEICIEEMVSKSVGLLIWKEAQKELLNEIYLELDIALIHTLGHKAVMKYLSNKYKEI